tara:strand:- start:103400 stop:103675 length:276 start_codon:yes stop_codon:yes gene_type:complete
MTFRQAHQIAFAIVLFQQRNLPAVFIYVKHPLAVTVPKPFFQSGLHHPHSMQFITQHLGIQMGSGQQLIILPLITVQGIGVIGNKQLPLTL